MSEYIIDTVNMPEQVREILEPWVIGSIVRCRYCVNWDYDSAYPNKTCFYFSDSEDGYMVITSPDEYCAWAERRDDD